MKVEGSPSCESCRSAPSTVYCRADAAALCAACDAIIHSANLLARRHQRVPVLPALAGGGLVVRPSLTVPYHVGVPVGLDESEREDDEEEEAASWLMLDPVKGNGQGAAALPPFAEVDEFLDLVGYNAGENQGSECCNGPMQQQQQQLQYSHEKSEESECLVPNELHQHQQSLQMEHGASNGLNYSVSLSSMDASVVPDTSNTSHVRASKGTIHLFSGHHPVPPRFDPMDREARVLRYREKRKARKFEKTVRYASRKAYAETRPRIKGRFAKKKSDAELEVDHMFSDAVLADSSFGVVPSF